MGFSLAIQQLRKTAKASEATKTAIEETARRMSMNHLLVLLPQLRVIEGDLDAAAADDDRRLAIRSLVSYSHTANQVASLMAGEKDVDGDLIERLRASARTAGAAKSTLVTSNRQTVRSVTKTAVEEIGEVSSFAAGLVAQCQVKAS
ncbi:hypothetical protein [Blastococcus atacamensis]|uniref:hypothetical protein n=1 Tax=Blastococcus atacamensis TaxID=2070508 RepID=UPI0012FFDA44|nr:hypothetical protein [Blastococcus atacamensis]